MMINGIKKIDYITSILIRWSLIFLMTIIPVISGVEVVFRYIIRAPLVGSNEILILFEVWLYFIGFVSAAREQSHITARAVEGLIKTSEGIARLRMLNAFLASFICIYMVNMAWDYFKYASRVAKTTSILQYPTLWYEIAPLVCFVPAVLYTMYEFYYYLKKIKKSNVDLKSRDTEIKDFLENERILVAGDKGGDNVWMLQ